MSSTRRVLILIASVGALAAAAAWLPLPTMPETVGQLGTAAAVAAVALGAALLVALVPRTPISIAYGALFGAIGGAACAIIAALLAATMTFAAGRWLGRDWILRHIGRYPGGRMATLSGWVDQQGVLGVAAVRAVPLGPYGLVGYVYGASTTPIRAYALGSLISAAPSAIAYAFVGAALAGGGGLDLAAIIPLTIGIGLWVLLAFRTRSRTPERANPPATAPPV